MRKRGRQNSRTYIRTYIVKQKNVHKCTKMFWLTYNPRENMPLLWLCCLAATHFPLNKSRNINNKEVWKKHFTGYDYFFYLMLCSCKISLICISISDIEAKVKITKLDKKLNRYPIYKEIINNILENRPNVRENKYICIC